jgi:hypothetical protein
VTKNPPEMDPEFIIESVEMDSQVVEDPVEMVSLNLEVPTGSCVFQNSMEWRNSKRLGNINMTMDEANRQYELALSPLLQHINGLMGQTLAWPNSRLVQSELDVDDLTSGVRWLTRLAFAIIYHHQHRPARLQWKSSSTTTSAECMENRLQKGIGRWDWECPNQTFLAFSQQDQGLGAGVDMFQQSIFAGIASQRVVLPINHIGAKGKAWTMASCSRRDMQCVFAPMSPCVLTMDQVHNATFLKNKQSFFSLYYNGVPPAEYNDTRVLFQGFANFGLKKERDNKICFQRAYNITQELLNELPADDATRPVWERTAEMLLNDQVVTLNCFRKAITMYMLRPNPYYRERLKEMLDANIPQDGFNPQTTIGLPIRATDKCKKESSCLSFEDYMELALETWKQALPNEPNPSVIVTSEDKTVYQKLRNLIDDPKQSPRYPVRFIMNDEDSQPGSGRFRAKDNITADDGMVAALSTLQLQLGSGVVRANCCSKFHTIMGEFLSIGGGGTIANDFQCLDHYEDPRFRICCWKSDGCIRQRNKDLEKWKDLHGASNVTEQRV